MPSRETNGFDPCVFPQENSCLPFLAMKTHAIFILENESIIRSGFPPISLTLHSSTLQTAQLQLLQIGARAPRSRLSVSASLGKGGGARRSEAGKMPPHRENLEAKRVRRVGKFQTFSAAFAHRSLEPVIPYCQASDNYI